jgi:hypothetical protein
VEQLAICHMGNMKEFMQLENKDDKSERFEVLKLYWEIKTTTLI